jgi:AcrR family transcriptional regulator
MPRPQPEPRPYHHRGLRQAVIESALAEIEALGPSRISMREIARRAGVSHAAPAHHFGDKRGIFTAIATEGFELLRSSTEPHLERPNALLNGGLAYIGFALGHRAYFEVMFRPDLYDTGDAELQTARIRAFDVLYRAVEQGLGSDDRDAVMGTAIAAWSAVHGFAALALGGNFPPELTADADTFAGHVAQGLIAVGDITRTQAVSGLPAMEAFGIDLNP